MCVVRRMKAYGAFLRELSLSPRSEWQVAIRLRGDQALYEGNVQGFQCVTNTVRYWYADPFLFCFNGQDYLFVEMFDRWKKKGVIGVCKVSNGKCGRFRLCLELPWHLSYPCVFEDEVGIHMIPECYQSGEVWMYRCVKFPYRWERERCLTKGLAVDTTPAGKGQWFTTFFASADQRKNDNLWRISQNGDQVCLIQDNDSVRGAGHFITTEQGECLRPSQNCGKTYGGHLVFNHVECQGVDYRETAILQVYAPDASCPEGALQIVCGDTKLRYNGIHTYNASSTHEVIDLKIYQPRCFVSFVRNFIHHVAGKINKGDR